MGERRANKANNVDWAWVLLAGGIGAFPVSGVLFVLAVLTANPCGPFADSCDDYGKTTTEAVVFISLALLGLAAGVGMLLAAIAMFVRRSRSGQGHQSSST